MYTDGIIFDLDGTLWDAVDEIMFTWNQVIERYPGLRDPIQRPEQESVMGLQMDEIAARLFPFESASRQLSLMQECVTEENRYLREHGALLYPAVRETLSALHEVYPLYIVSNCQQGYIEAFLHAHALESNFDGFLCYGDTGKSKGENIRTVVEAQCMTNPVYVGDTQGDQNAAQLAGIPFVYAAYGFGSASNYDAIIHQFKDLLQIFPLNPQ